VVLQPLLAFSRVLEPELSLAYGNRDSSSVKVLFLLTLRLVTWFGLLSLIALAIVGPSIYRFWTHNAFALDGWVFGAFAVTSVIAAVSGVAITVHVSANEHQWVAVRYLIVQGFGCTALLWALTHVWGIRGASTALLAVEAVILVIAWKHTLNRIKATSADVANALLACPWHGISTVKGV
jgi:O-antigen/teichoic acid export membrane protein